MKKKPHGNVGKQNAKKENPRTSRVWGNVTPREKAAVVRAANGQSVSDYIRGKLELES